MMDAKVYLTGIIAGVLYLITGIAWAALASCALALTIAEVWTLIAKPMQSYDTWTWRFNYLKIVVHDYWWKSVLRVVAGCSATCLVIVLCQIGGAHGC
jgi:hypothetical protein